jgi:hypothetical protein
VALSILFQQQQGVMRKLLNALCLQKQWLNLLVTVLAALFLYKTNVTGEVVLISNMLRLLQLILGPVVVVVVMVKWAAAVVLLHHSPLHPRHQYRKSCPQKLLPLLLLVYHHNFHVVVYLLELERSQLLQEYPQM